MSRAAPKRSPGWILIPVGIVLLAAGFLAGASMTDSKIRTVAAPVPTTSPQAAVHEAHIEACQVRQQLLNEEADVLVRNFVRHGKAHKAMGEMPLGDRMDPKPGTVRWEWKITLAQLWEHEPAYRKAEKNYKEAKCDT